MHPHLLALPFVLLTIALALNLWHHPATFSFWGNDESCTRPWRARFRFWSGYGLVIGALGFLNTWDLPIYLGLTVAVLLLRAWRQQPAAPLIEIGWQLLPDVLILGAYSILLYLPFWIGLRSQAGGILPNLFNATHWPQFAVMFLPLLLPLLGALLAVIRQAELRWPPILGQSVLLLAGILLGSLLLGTIVGTPYLQAILRGESIMGMNVELDAVIASLTQRLLHPWTAWLLLIGVVALLTAFLRPRTPLLDAELTFPALLALLGLGLTLVPEFVYLKDIFSTRMNTIFKFYFQAWVCWSLAGAWWLTQRSAGRTRHIALTASTLLIMAGLLYPLYAIPTRAAQNRNFYGKAGAGTLDGAVWLADSHPEDWDAINWLNANVSGRPVILETPTDSHEAYVYEGRVSALTGLPTVLGWSGHEYQWRGNYEEQARREQDIQHTRSCTSTSGRWSASAIPSRVWRNSRCSRRSTGMKG
jgi:YYY domain-containing protein